jgi:5S rRNA maturation endonuclease (ribonuclease M5)
MKTTDLVRKSIVISGRAAIRAAVDAHENLKYQYYDLMNDRISLNDAVSLEEQCEIFNRTKSAVRNLWTRVRKWASNETLVPYSVIQDLDYKGEIIRTWMTYNIANPKEYQRFVIARKERSIAGMRELDKANLIKTKLTKKQRLQADARMKRHRQKINGGNP